MMDIKNNYFFKNFDSINIVYSDYWDFNLANDRLGDCYGYATNCKDSCKYDIIEDGLVVWFDINKSGTTIDGTSLTSLVEWSGRTITPSSGFTLNDWGLTGIDNGRVSCLSGETLIITSASTKLVLYPVTGYTVSFNFSGCSSGVTGCTTGCTVGSGQYIYPWMFHTGTTTTEGCPVGDTVCLDGGFYQGFFKLDRDVPAPILVEYVDSCCRTGYTLTSVSATTAWQVMPTDFPIGWSMETWIQSNNEFCQCISGFTSGTTSGDTGTTFCVTGTTLNDIYPNNKNFFFYIGTRAENKFWNDFSGETGLSTTTGIPLSPSAAKVFEEHISDGSQSWFNIKTPWACNCNCVCTGCTANNCCGVEEGPTDPNIITGGQNWFSVSAPYGEGCCNTTRCFPNESSITTGTTYSYCDQLSENALGFRITDDGRIGYRKMTVSGDCYNNKYRITGTMMEEGYSEPNVISTGTSWNHIAVTYTAGGGLKNTLPSGTLKFWVNGLVKYKVDNFIGLQLRALNEWSDKQIGVPFNMSWGGGTQGLIESQTFNGPDYSDRDLHLQQNFAGSFEGELSQLRFYDKPLNVLEIRNNFFVDCRRYCRPDTFGGAQIIQPNSEFCGQCKSGPLPPYIFIPCDSNNLI